MRPWSTDRPPAQQEDTPPWRGSFTNAPGRNGAFPPSPEGAAPASWRTTSRPVDRAMPMPTTAPAPQPAPGSGPLGPSDMLTLAGTDVTQPLVAGHFGRATGMNLKVRFLLALTLLSLAPAFLLVLLYQQANQNTLTQAGQQALTSTAQSDSNALTHVLASRQAYLAQLAKQDSIVQVSHGNGETGQAEALLNTAHLSTPDALAWIVLNGSDQIVAASPTDSEGQTLQAASAILTNPADLEKFVQTQRAAPAPKAGQTPLVLASGIDNGLAEKVWVATLAFVTPTAPAHSGIVLAVFSLPALVNAYVSALPADPNSYACLADLNGTILGVTGNQQLAQKLGQPLAVAPLQSAVQAMSSGQDTSALAYQDPTTGADEIASGYMSKDLHMVILVVAAPGALSPVTTGLLQGRNLPLIFLIIFVITSLVATWVALPIVRPIRRATREILASTD
ncbi:MAG TPA: hypothetical protein VKT82_12515, partial [Ktedonobacterales bacterium]|nr:hypothetical protein [Ktedonobacterales bacterium]